MSNKYTTNKNAIADCDVCGFQFKLKELKETGHVHLEKGERSNLATKASRLL